MMCMGGTCYEILFRYAHFIYAIVIYVIAWFLIFGISKKICAKLMRFFENLL